MKVSTSLIGPIIFTLSHWMTSVKLATSLIGQTLDAASYDYALLITDEEFRPLPFFSWI